MLAHEFTILTSLLVKSKSCKARRKVNSIQVLDTSMSFAKVTSTEVEAYFQLLCDYNTTDAMLVKGSIGRYDCARILPGWAYNVNDMYNLCHLHTCPE